MYGNSRAQRVQEAQRLREHGWKIREIADFMQVSQGSVSRYLSDPEGKLIVLMHEKQRRRCPVCNEGIVTRHAARWCMACERKRIREKSRWTKATIIGGLQRFYFEHGKAPTQADILEHNLGHYPSCRVIQKHFGSWNEGLIAAGLTPRRVRRKNQ